MIRRLLPVFGLLLMVQPLANSQDKLPSEDQRLEAFFKAHLDEEFKRRPLEATGLGDHRHDHLLEDVSAKSRQQWTAAARQTLQNLEKTIRFDKLTRAGQIDFEIFKHDLVTTLWLAENTRPFEDDPRTYNQYITESVYLLLTQSTLPMPQNVRNCAERMRQIPRIIAAARESLTAAAEGVRRNGHQAEQGRHRLL